MSLGEKKFFSKNRQCRRPRHLEKISKIEKFFFRASSSEWFKTSGKQVWAKKNFFEKILYVSKTKILGKNFKNQKKIFCASQRASFSEHWKWLEVLPRYTPASSQHFWKSEKFFARCARGVARFARSTFLALNRREKLATFCFWHRAKIAFRARPPLKIASRFFGASFARKFPRFARTSLTRAGTSNEKKWKKCLVRLTHQSEKNWTKAALASFGSRQALLAPLPPPRV